MCAPQRSPFPSSQQREERRLLASRSTTAAERQSVGGPPRFLLFNQLSMAICRCYGDSTTSTCGTPSGQMCPRDGTHVCAVFGQRGVGQLADLLPVHLGGAAVVLGVGVAGGAAVLAEERRLQTGSESSASHAPGRAPAAARLAYRVGVPANLHTSELEPVPVGVQLCGPAEDIQRTASLRQPVHPHSAQVKPQLGDSNRVSTMRLEGPFRWPSSGLLQHHSGVHLKLHLPNLLHSFLKPLNHNSQLKKAEPSNRCCASSTNLMKLRCTPSERWIPEQSMHRNTPYEMLAQLGFLAAQSKHTCWKDGTFP